MIISACKCQVEPDNIPTEATMGATTSAMATLIDDVTEWLSEVWSDMDHWRCRYMPQRSRFSRVHNRNDGGATSGTSVREPSREPSRAPYCTRYRPNIDGPIMSFLRNLASSVTVVNQSLLAKICTQFLGALRSGEPEARHIRELPRFTYRGVDPDA